MRVLVSWLRELVPVEAAIDELADVLMMRGFEVSAVEAVGHSRASTPPDDAVLDLEITTNRPDCLSVTGIAREVATVYDLDLIQPRLDPLPEGSPRSDLSVVIDDPELCLRYVAATLDVTPRRSPPWLASRLEASGVRPINCVVDVTNYVMLECGHPMHAFDLDRLTGATLRVRLATSDESIRTLDGHERSLERDMLVIADAHRPQAVAGIMGGSDSEVSDATRRVALESAYFRPTSIRRTSKRLALSTDASYRFERGADIDAPRIAMQRALTLLAEIGVGTPRGAVIDEYPGQTTRPTITLRHQRIGKVLGLSVDPDFVSHTLERLGFEVAGDDQDDGHPATGPTSPIWTVSVPSFRVDVKREIDLIEEVARHHGYDRLPSTFPAMVRPPAPPSPSLRRHQVLRRTLTAAGCSEAINYSFLEREAAAPFVAGGQGEAGLVAIANPLSEKYAVLRPSLLPGLLDSVARNRRRERRDVWLFEIGKRFDRALGETPGVGIIITGAAEGEHWSRGGKETRAVDLFDVKGIVERMCDAVGVAADFVPANHAPLIEGRAADIIGTGPGTTRAVLGHLGELRPALAGARGFPSDGDALYVAEISLAPLESIAKDRDRLTATPVPRHPSVVRDLALVVDQTLPAASLRGTIRSAAPGTLTSILEFDRYAGKGVPTGRVSLALRLTFRATDRTLTDHEVQIAVDAIVREVEQRHGATLRE